jgi:plasmid stabilization system protein ParE
VTFRVEFRPLASADVAEAFSWYEGQRTGLGTEFEADLDRTVALLRYMANAGPVVHRALRRVLLTRFPFAVYYELAGETVRIRAVVHTRRHPSTWKRRA